jgi:uncharacterized membrane protein YeaQ/YmgE (transglycosylase-associated protein family)
MHVLWTILIGFVAGVVAKFIMPGKDGGGFILTTLLGVAGAIVATYLGRLIGWYEEGQAGGFIAAVVGSIILLAAYRLIKRKS